MQSRIGFLKENALFKFTINNPKIVDVVTQLTRVSIPFSINQLSIYDALVLFDEFGQQVICEFTCLAQWPNTNIKLLQANALISIEALGSINYFVCQSQNTNQTLNSPDEIIPLLMQKTSGAIEAFKLNIDKQAKIEITEPATSQKVATFSIQLNEQTKQDSGSLALLPLSVTIKKGQVLATTKFEMEYKSPALAIPIKLMCRTEFVGHTGELQLYLTIRNPNPANHPNGTWDLGDPNSFLFSELSVNIHHNLSTSGIKVETDKIIDFQSLRSLHIAQKGSGGTNWQSPIHLDRDNKVDVDDRGYSLTQIFDDEQLTDVKTKGLRASPIVGLVGENTVHAIFIEHFWQNFPSAINLKAKEIQLDLFPGRNGKQYELQPGEQKTFKIVMQSVANTDQAWLADQNVEIVYPSDAFAQTHLMPLLKHDDSEQALASLITRGITDEHNFFAKREHIDEYGWRNFGELFADHETEGLSYDDLLISHYNNQYDPIYGFLRQYLTTGDSSWFELADNLAKHVIDIDIYHTLDDKAEYNGGLFWHTDHYCPALTATHRTYSARQSTGVYDGHAGGGGPGGQHCYTSGLLLHYWLTGYEPSKEAVITLTKWITNVYEGGGTFLETLLAIKNSHRKDVKNILTDQYPLDRGTGNYVIALLDTYQLTNLQKHLDCAGKVLKSTISVTDNIALKNLNDVESNWFYTVLLQAVARYLLIKESLGQQDNSFLQLQNALLHYANYMVDKEIPYLDKPDILEFPNHTWAAQDLRKSCVFYSAAYFAVNPLQKQLFEQKAVFFYDYVTCALKDEPTAVYTRILALLMQNSGYKSWYNSNHLQSDFAPQIEFGAINVKHSVVKLLLNKALSLNIKNELAWLRKKSAQVDSVLNKLGIR